MTHSLSWSWRPKRARTALNRRAQTLSSSRIRGTRDWANLGGEGPASLIAELALANDVADYVRFRAACRPWRLRSADPRAAGLDARFHPRHWIMLDKAHDVVGPRCRRFLNVSTGECIRTELPELAEHTLLALTPEGLLLLLHEPTLAVRLLNPLTRQLTDLPPVTALMTEEERARRARGNLRDSISIYSVGLPDASTVAVSFRFPTVLAVAKPGDERWTLVHDKFIDSTLPFAGRFYCAIGSSVMALNSNSDSDQHKPRLVTAIERRRSFHFCRMSDSLHLFHNAGELMLVHRSPRLDKDAQRKKYKMEYMVYRVDLAAGALVPIKGLSGRAVFMGRRRVVSVPVGTGTFPSLAADTLYPGCDCEEKTMLNKIEGYNVADGSSQRFPHDSCVEMEQPYNMVDCLSYCIKGNGGHLA